MKNIEDSNQTDSNQSPDQSKESTTTLHQKIARLRYLPPDTYFDDPAEKLDGAVSDQSSSFALAAYGITRIKEWASQGNAKQRALRHDLVTLCVCPQFLPCKRPTAAWCGRQHGVSRQWACRLQQEFARLLGDKIKFRGQRFQT